LRFVRLTVSAEQSPLTNPSSPSFTHSFAEYLL
jgi:hypothetical protein